jgi:hypothetical protein
MGENAAHSTRRVHAGLGGRRPAKAMTVVTGQTEVTDAYPAGGTAGTVYATAAGRVITSALDVLVRLPLAHGTGLGSSIWPELLHAAANSG